MRRCCWLYTGFMSMSVTMTSWYDRPGILTGDFTNVGLDVKISHVKVLISWEFYFDLPNLAVGH
jgi:hypothetical protein